MTGQGRADEISMVIEDIRDIARDDIGTATDHAEDSSHTFASVGVGIGDFSSVPMARSFALQHQAAHEVFRDTIRGVLADLEDFRARLLACADGHETTDASVRAHLQGMSNSYEHHQLHSRRNYDHGRREHTEALDTGSAPGGADQPPSSAAGGQHGGGF